VHAHAHHTMLFVTLSKITPNLIRFIWELLQIMRTVYRNRPAIERLDWLYPWT